MKVVVVDKIHKQYHDHVIFDDFSMEIEQVSIPWWRSHPIHENRATESIWTEPCNPLLRATKSTKRATSIYEITLIFYLIFE